MELGEWAAFKTRPLVAGPVGLLVDDVTGYALVTARMPGTWTVSAELTIDVFAGLHRASTVRAEAQVVDADEIGGFATVQLFDENEALVGQGSQRSRWVKFGDGNISGPSEPTAPTGVFADLEAMLDTTLTRDGDAMVLTLTSEARLENPQKIMHGGITFCAVEMVTSALLNVDGESGLSTTSVRLAYSRPIVEDDTVKYRAVQHHRGRSSSIVTVTATVKDRVAAVAHVISATSPS
ncbi:MAG: hypothetical protein JWO10_2244 [Microbacteriaceae bacterium]|nr:hypothetical protein [Microbacteriaceae bacterium]